MCLNAEAEWCAGELSAREILAIDEETRVFGDFVVEGAGGGATGC